MGLWDSVKKQFLDVIEWTEPDNETLSWRFPVMDREIQQGGQLTVRESQAALFVDEGRAADLFGPGRHELITKNLPILTDLRSWPFGFESPFKSDIYFFSVRQKLGQRWGTPQPIAVRDREFGSIQVRMFGTFSYHIAEPKRFFERVSGTRETFRTDELSVQLVPLATAAAASLFGQANVSFLDVAANQAALSEDLKKRLAEPFGELGIVLDQLVVESVTLPPELTDALNKRQSMGIVGDLGRYTQYETASSIPDAAKNPGGIAGIGAGLAAGAAMGQAMTSAMASRDDARSAETPTRPCVSCGKAIGPSDPFCRHCGKPQARSCSGCSAAVPADAAFCPKCGAKQG